MGMQNRSRSLPLLVILLATGFGAGRLGSAPHEAELERARAGALDLSLAFQDVAGRAGRAVVSVRAEVQGRRGGFRRQAQGSGVIVDPAGLVVTNHHVVQGAERVRATLADGTEIGARILGVDPEADLALLELEAKDLPSLLFAEREEVRVGQWALAIGNPLGLGHTVTAGIVSGIGRADIGIATYEDFVQTDAAINPGNSGGALVDLRGRLIGINTAVGTGPGGNLGIGFAIPAHMVRSIVAELAERGRVRRGWLGVEMLAVTDEAARARGFSGESRVAVGKVRRSSPAAEAGLEPGDLILSIHGQPVRRSRDLLNAIAQVLPGTQVELQLWRNGEELSLAVTLAERSPEVLLGSQGE